MLLVLPIHVCTTLCTSAGTYLIQNIRSQPCYNSSRCQLDIMYDIAVDSKLVTGSFIALIHDNGKSYYFVNRGPDNGARDSVVSVSGLPKGHYSLLVLLLNENRLRIIFPQPASRVINVTADGKYFRRLSHCNDNNNVSMIMHSSLCIYYSQW